MEYSEHGAFVLPLSPDDQFFLKLSYLQYIFVNMFTGEAHCTRDAIWEGNLRYAGLVVENFSYVYQTTGGAKSVTREEMRAFKKVWAEFANPKTELLERAQLVPFFGVSSFVVFFATSDAACRD